MPVCSRKTFDVPAVCLREPASQPSLDELRARRPFYNPCSVVDALENCDWSGWHLSRKEDGVCERREAFGCAVWGDAMRNGRFMVWDIDTASDADIRHLTWTLRERALTALLKRIPKAWKWLRCESGSGVEFIRQMVAAARRDQTPDVIVAKRMDGKFGNNYVKVKLLDPFDCFVTECNERSIRVAQMESGKTVDRGWCAVMGGCPLPKVGDVVEIMGTLTKAGKIREPRIVKVGSRVKIRRDKRPQDCVSSS